MATLRYFETLQLCRGGHGRSVGGAVYDDPSAAAAWRPKQLGRVIYGVAGHGVADWAAFIGHEAVRPPDRWTAARRPYRVYGP